MELNKKQLIADKLDIIQNTLDEDDTDTILLDALTMYYEHILDNLWYYHDKD